MLDKNKKETDKKATPNMEIAAIKTTIIAESLYKPPQDDPIHYIFDAALETILDAVERNDAKTIAKLIPNLETVEKYQDLAKGLGRNVSAGLFPSLFEKLQPPIKFKREDIEKIREVKYPIEYIHQAALVTIFNAIETGDTDKIRRLIPNDMTLDMYETLDEDEPSEYDLDSDYSPDISKSIILCKAAELGKDDIIKYLVDTCSANLYNKDKNGFLAMELAAMNGHTEAVKILLPKYKPDIISNAFGFALRAKNRDIAELLYPRVNSKEIALFLTLFSKGGAAPDPEALDLLAICMKADTQKHYPLLWLDDFKTSGSKPPSDTSHGEPVRPATPYFGFFNSQNTPLDEEAYLVFNPDEETSAEHNSSETP